MFKKILALTVCSLTASTAFGAPQMQLSYEKQRSYAYKALTYIATADVPPPTSKAAQLDNLKNNSQDVLAELCFYAGALQLRLMNVFNVHPYALQASYPMRTQLQTLIENGQQNLRAACAVNDTNKKLMTSEKIINVQNAIADVTSDAISLRNTVSFRH